MRYCLKLLPKFVLLLLLSLLLSAVAGCSLIFPGNEDDEDDAQKKKQDTAKQEDPRRYPDAIIKRFVRTSVNKNGEVEWVLKSREGRVFEKKDTIYLTDFIISFYKSGEVVSILEARRGVLNNRTKQITARSKVFLKAENGRTLRTEELYGDNKRNIITNSVFNRIIQEDGSVLTGTHLWAHNDLQVFRLKNVHGITAASNFGLTNTQDQAEGETNAATAADTNTSP